MTHVSPTFSVLGLALALTGCGATVVEAEADESSDDGSFPGLVGAGDEGGESSDSDGGAFAEGFVSDASDDDESDGGVADDGEAPDDGDESDDGSVAPEDVPCLDVADCIIGQPFALEVCAAEYDVSPTQCGLTPVCTRELGWFADGAPVLPPDVLEISYSHSSNPAFITVDHACYGLGDGVSCVVPCDVHPAPPAPLKFIRATYVCAGASLARTAVLSVAELAGMIELDC